MGKAGDTKWENPDSRSPWIIISFLRLSSGESYKFSVLWLLPLYNICVSEVSGLCRRPWGRGSGDKTLNLFQSENFHSCLFHWLAFIPFKNISAFKNKSVIITRQHRPVIVFQVWDSEISGFLFAYLYFVCKFLCSFFFFFSEHRYRVW